MKFSKDVCYINQIQVGDTNTASCNFHAMHTSKQNKITVSLLDSHRIVRDGLQSLIERFDDLAVVGSAAKASELIDCMGAVQVDVVVMGLILDGEDGLRCIGDWSKAYPATRFLVLSQLPESIYAQRVLQAGGCGYLMKNIQADDLLDGIRRAAADEVVVSPSMVNHLITNLSKRTGQQRGDTFERLSDRELHVLSMVGQGHATAAIARGMGISHKTVSTFKERIKVKLALDTSQQLTQVAMQRLGRMQ